MVLLSVYLIFIDAGSQLYKSHSALLHFPEQECVQDRGVYAFLFLSKNGRLWFLERDWQKERVIERKPKKKRKHKKWWQFVIESEGERETEKNKLVSKDCFITAIMYVITGSNLSLGHFITFLLTFKTLKSVMSRSLLK